MNSRPEIGILTELYPHEQSWDRVIVALRQLRARAMEFPGYHGGTFCGGVGGAPSILVLEWWASPEERRAFLRDPLHREVQSEIGRLLTSRPVERYLLPEDRL